MGFLFISRREASTLLRIFMGMCFTKKAKAIKTIDGYIKEIPNINVYAEAHAWKSKVVSSLEKWIGKDNHIVTTFINNNGIEVTWHPYEFRPSNTHDLTRQLNQAQDYIRINGVIKNEGFNIVSTKNNLELFYIAIALITFGGTCVWFFDDYIRIPNAEKKIETKLPSMASDFKTDKQGSINESEKKDSIPH